MIKLITVCRQKVAKVKAGGLTDKAEIAEAVRKATKTLAMENFDDIHRNFIEVNAMSDKRAVKQGLEVSTGQFVLTELFTVSHKAGTLYLERAELTLLDGDQITLQKEQNIAAAERAFREWDFEWRQVIRPLLVLNPTWRYRNAYEHLVSHGGVPTPPSEDETDD